MWWSTRTSHSCSTSIHGDLVRVVMEYADIPQLQHECVVRSYFSDEVSSYRQEVDAARLSLRQFVSDTWMPDIKKLLQAWSRSRKQSSSFTFHPRELRKAFRVIFRFRKYRGMSYEMDMLRNFLFHWHAVQASECNMKDEENGMATFSYKIEIPKRVARRHLKRLVRCSNVKF
eukprot:TRINITY_DN3856_c1_g1_i3.p1 TRINITY_DN3856_c1_g1~~TRINITY_DN3856_c1_g1_i3.p1  ORF type:complete len:173 (+),score=13.24 TRINITY_DN3856_c1_g1_i3:185-703(+)